MPKLIAGICLFSLMLLLTGSVMAQPGTIPYEGRLTAPSGAKLPQDTATMVFTIFAGAADVTPLWSETDSAVALDNGVFNVELGSKNPFPANLFDGTTRYLEIMVRNETLSPRQPILSVPYAFRSGMAAGVPPGSIGSTEIANGSIASVDLAANSVGSTQVTDGSLTATDLQNEPGITSTTSNRSIDLAPVDSTVASITLNAPSAGYIVVVATGLFNFNHSLGTKDIGRVSISSSNSLDFYYLCNVTKAANDEIDADTPMPFSVTRIQAVGAGAQTFNLVADSFSGQPFILRYQLTGMFFPTSYGAVGLDAANRSVTDELNLIQTGRSTDNDQR